MVASQEITTRTEGELALANLAETFPALLPDDDMQELLDETFDGAPVVRDLVRVKFPSGGGLSWVLTTGGEETHSKELTGIPVLVAPQRSFWSNPNPTNSPPECMSRDGKVPLDGGLFAPGGARSAENPAADCVSCPMAQWGSDLKGRKGQGCREQRLVFLVTPGSMLPTLLTIPPSSKTIITEFFKGLVAAERTGFWMVECGFSLVKANSDGQDYSELKPRVIRRLTSEEIAVTKAYKDTVKAWVAASPPMTFMNNLTDDAIDMENLT